MRDWPRDSMKEEKLEGELIVSVLCSLRHFRGRGCVRDTIGLLHVV